MKIPLFIKMRDISSQVPQNDIFFYQDFNLFLNFVTAVFNSGFCKFGCGIHKVVFQL